MVYDQRAYDDAFEEYEENEDDHPYEVGEEPDLYDFELPLNKRELEALDGVKLDASSYDSLLKTCEIFYSRLPGQPEMRQPVLRYKDEQLYVEILFVTLSKVEAHHIRDAALVCKSVFESDKWPDYYYFEVPDELEHYHVGFFSDASETPRMDSGEIDRITAQWMGPKQEFEILKVHEKLDAMELEDVISLYKELRALGIRGNDDPGNEKPAVCLWEAVSSQLMRRFRVASIERLDFHLAESSTPGKVEKTLEILF